MNEIETKDMITTHLHIPSTPFENQWIGGEDGITQRHVGSYAMPKNIEAHIFLKSHDYLDYELLRDYLYGIFGFGKPFYIVSKNQRGKRHKVVLESSFMPERLSNTVGTVVVQFTTCISSYAESIGTTQDIQSNGISANDEQWGFGMGLIADDDSLIYTHKNKSNFKIYNAGNVEVHPFEQDIKVEIDFPDYVYANNHFQLKNITNGSTFRINEQVLPLENYTLDGPNITKNGLNALRLTNKQFIVLDPGWNEFEVTGNTQATISFDFRFYYK